MTCGNDPSDNFESNLIDLCRLNIISGNVSEEETEAHKAIEFKIKQKVKLIKMDISE